jgi:hypothetical protein
MSIPDITRALDEAAGIPWHEAIEGITIADFARFFVLEASRVAAS